MPIIKGIVKKGTAAHAWINNIDAKHLGIGITLLFGLVLGCGMANHEMWRDEYEQYLFRIHNGFIDSGSPFYIVYNLLCWITIQLVPSLISFKVLHFSLMVGTVALVAFKSPFDNIEKTFICFNYYFVYEYGVICRYYGLITLIVFFAVMLICYKKRKYFILSILVLVLAEINPLSATLSFGISCYLISDVYLYFKCNKIDLKKNKELLVSALLFALGGVVLIANVAIFISKKSNFNPFECPLPPVITIVNQIWNSYFPIPDFHPIIRFWGTNIFSFLPFYQPQYQIVWKDVTVNFVIPFIISIILLISISVRFLSTPVVLVTYLSTTLLQFAFIQHFIKIYEIRYIGFLFLSFLFCYWLHLNQITSSKSVKRSQFDRLHQFISKNVIVRALNKLFKPLLYLLLIAQVYASCYALIKDSKYKFSHSEDLGQFLKENDYKSSHVLIGYPDYTTECISALLETKVYFPQINSYGYYCECYNDKRKKILSAQEVLNSCIYFSENQNKKAILILNYPITETQSDLVFNSTFGSQSSAKSIINFTGENQLTPLTKIKFLKSFNDEVICGDEVYYIYEIIPTGNEMLNIFR